MCTESERFTFNACESQVRKFSNLPSQESLPESLIESLKKRSALNPLRGSLLGRLVEKKKILCSEFQ